MTDIVITPANVIPAGDAIREDGIAGASLLAGQTVYKEAATSLIKLADANSATAEAMTPYGITLNPALTGQAVAVATSGNLGLGAILTAGQYYVQSATPGGIAPIADLVATWKSTMVGYATTTSNLVIRLVPTGVTL